MTTPFSLSIWHQESYDWPLIKGCFTFSPIASISPSFCVCHAGFCSQFHQMLGFLSLSLMMTGGQFLFIFTSDTLTSPHHDRHWDVFLIHFQPNTFLSPHPHPPPPLLSWSIDIEMVFNHFQPNTFLSPNPNPPLPTLHFPMMTPSVFLFSTRHSFLSLCQNIKPVT